MRFAIGLVALTVVAACGSDSGATTTPKTNTNATYDVTMPGTTFLPAVGLQIAPNDTILWHFGTAADNQGHNVRFDRTVSGAPADLPVQKSGTARSVFATKGDFTYFCDVHPGMNGEIVVQ